MNLLLGAFASSLLTFGCYTMVSHPGSMVVSGSGAPSESHGGDYACGECHVESEWLGYFDHSLIYGSAGYYSYDWWYDYYQRPWWFDEYWYDGGGSSVGDGGERGRSSWTKRSVRRGEGQPSTPVTGPQISPGTTGSSSGPAIGAAGSNSQSTQQNREKTPAPSYGKKKRNPRR